MECKYCKGEVKIEADGLRHWYHNEGCLLAERIKNSIENGK